MVRLRYFIVFILVNPLYTNASGVNVEKYIYYNDTPPSIIDDCILISHTNSISGNFVKSKKLLNSCGTCRKNKLNEYLCEQIRYNNNFWDSKFKAASKNLYKMDATFPSMTGKKSGVIAKADKIYEVKSLKVNHLNSFITQNKKDYRKFLKINGKYVNFKIDTGALFGNTKNQCINERTSTISLISGDLREVNYCKFSVWPDYEFPLTSGSKANIIGISYLLSFDELKMRNSTNNFKTKLYRDSDVIFIKSHIQVNDSKEHYANLCIDTGSEYSSGTSTLYRKVRDDLKLAKLKLARIKTVMGDTYSTTKKAESVKITFNDYIFKLSNMPIQTKSSPVPFCDIFLGMDFLKENLNTINFEYGFINLELPNRKNQPLVLMLNRK